MNQINRSSENQHKIVQLLRSELTKLKSDHLQTFKGRMFQQKKNDKKLQKLSFKIGMVLKIDNLDAKIIEELHTLQQKIRDEF